MSRLKEHIAHIEGTCGEENFIVTLKYEKRKES